MKDSVDLASKHRKILNNLNNVVFAVAILVYLGLVITVIIEQAYFAIVIFTCVLLAAFLAHYLIRTLLIHLKLFESKL